MGSNPIAPQKLTDMKTTCIVNNQIIIGDLWEVYGHQTLLGYFDAVKQGYVKINRKLLEKATHKIQSGDCYITKVQYVSDIINNVCIYKQLVTFDDTRLTTKQWLNKYKQHLRLKKNES